MPGLGLAPADFERLRSDVEIIIHSAAETSFLRSRNCHETNVVGTRNVIDFARTCVRNPLIVYISTATNGGVLSHCVLREEDGCRPDGPHHNDYTYSKAVAEQMVHDSGLPYVVLRPSIVFSAGLPDPAFARAILWFVPLLNEFDAVPVTRHSRLDVVPVSFVVESTLALLQSYATQSQLLPHFRRTGVCLHLCRYRRVPGRVLQP